MKERANRLYELRKSRNLTQTAVAYRLNLSLSRISAYENGENIPCDVLRVFANFYSVSIDYILRFSDRTVGGSGVNLHISEQKLLDLYRNLPPDGKAVIDGIFFKKISPNRIIYDLIYNEIQNKGRFGDKTKCFLHNNNFLS